MFDISSEDCVAYCGCIKIRLFQRYYLIHVSCSNRLCEVCRQAGSHYSNMVYIAFEISNIGNNVATLVQTTPDSPEQYSWLSQPKHRKE